MLFQTDESSVTPNGEIHVVGVTTYFNEYSLQGAILKVFFVYEMVHVWQYQLKILSPVTASIGQSIRNLFDYVKAYQYELEARKDLLKYRIELMAQLIEDYYLLFS